MSTKEFFMRFAKNVFIIIRYQELQAEYEMSYKGEGFKQRAFKIKKSASPILKFSFNRSVGVEGVFVKI